MKADKPSLCLYPGQLFILLICLCGSSADTLRVSVRIITDVARSISPGYSICRNFKITKVPTSKLLSKIKKNNTLPLSPAISWQIDMSEICTLINDIYLAVLLALTSEKSIEVNSLQQWPIFHTAWIRVLRKATETNQ